MFDSLERESPAQPGGGEELVEKRKGVVVRRGLKEARIKGARADEQEPDEEAYGAGRASN
jgi:hypothetical protein